jgi:hypothetical protein
LRAEVLKRPHALARTAGATQPAASRARRLPWAALLRRVFAQDTVFCPGGGRRTVVAFGRRRARRNLRLGQCGSAARAPTAPEVTPAVDRHNPGALGRWSCSGSRRSPDERAPSIPRGDLSPVGQPGDLGQYDQVTSSSPRSTGTFLVVPLRVRGIQDVTSIAGDVIVRFPTQVSWLMPIGSGACWKRFQAGREPVCMYAVSDSTPGDDSRKKGQGGGRTIIHRLDRQASCALQSKSCAGNAATMTGFQRTAGSWACNCNYRTHYYCTQYR